MTDQPICKTAEFYVLRSPALPLDSMNPKPPATEGPIGKAGSPAMLGAQRVGMRQVLRELLDRGDIREAVALASPDLAARINEWLQGALEASAGLKLERTLLKYLGRMSSRCTPFGLFAAVSTGSWGQKSDMALGSWSACRKSVRLDWGVLEAMLNRLEREPDVRVALKFSPNTSLDVRGGWYRYLERRDLLGQERVCQLEAVEATPHLDHVVQRAYGGACIQELEDGLLTTTGADPSEAKTFLNQLIEAQVLCGNFHPPLTCSDPLGYVVNLLRSNRGTEARAEEFEGLCLELRNIQKAAIGTYPDGYGHLASVLSKIGVASELRNSIQIDLFRPSSGLSLSLVIRKAIEAGVDTLQKLTPPPIEGPLDRFRAAFEDRYGARWVPLLQALDEESGIGFDGGELKDSPLLDGVPLPQQASPHHLSERDRILMARTIRWQGKRIWDLDDDDFEALSSPNPRALPASFAALVNLSATDLSDLDGGNFQLFMDQYSGPSAARLLARFASGDPRLEELLRQHLRREEAQNPEAIFAEVVHIPDGRMGNVLARPSVRDYEIPYLAVAGVSSDRTILPADLQVTVRGGRIFLYSPRLGREIIPRLSSAHNFKRGPAVYRFLAHLQDQDGFPGGWTWGSLDEMPFLPRVTRGRHVMSRARWRIESRELRNALKDSEGSIWGAFQFLRTTRALPRFVMLTDADNTLQVDLDHISWVETLHQLVANRSAFLLTECFPYPGRGLVTSSEGRFAHELAVPFEVEATKKPRKVPVFQGHSSLETRAYSPGSEWLYLKLYCGPVTADRVLVALAPLIRKAKNQGLWDHWHFIRYRDPGHHLRLRFHGLPGRLTSELLPLLHRHLEEHLASGALWKWQVDTFEPEFERYGGPLGFGLAERWFSDDSQWVLDRLIDGVDANERWMAGLRRVDAIWDGLSLDVRSRRDLAKISRDAFREEFNDTGKIAIQIGNKFRSHRKELEPGFPINSEAKPSAGLGALRPVREALEQNQIQENLASIASSFAHMHLNRLLQRDQRESEWVVMEFLGRLYETALAREVGRPLSSG